MSLITIVNNGRPIHVASQGPLRLRRSHDGTHHVESGIFLPPPVNVSQMPDGAPAYEFSDGTMIIDREGNRQILPPPQPEPGSDYHSSNASSAGAYGTDYAGPTRNAGHRAKAGLLLFSGLLAACSNILVSPSIETPNPTVPTQAPASPYTTNQQQNEAEGNTAYTAPPTPAPNSPPRIALINAPKLAIVGQPVTLEAIIEETDGDELQIRWEQLRNPDRYTGREYVSSTQITLQTDGANAFFTPEWPGNYRVQLTVKDNDGEETRTVDVLVKSEKPLFDIMGITITLHAPNPRNINPNVVKSLIDRAYEKGANYIQINPNLAMTDSNDNTVYRCSELPFTELLCHDVSDETLREWILYAKSKGMGVAIKPHVAVVVGGFTDSYSISPKSDTAWFSSYKAQMVRYAIIANEAGADMFSVGDELSGVHRKTSYWADLISMIRNVFSGKLYYSDSQFRHNDARRIATFWNLLDYIGNNAFIPASDGNNSPTEEEMVAVLHDNMNKLLVRTSAQYGVPILGSDFGRPDFDGNNYDLLGTGRPGDTQEQADTMNATTRALYLSGAKGIFWWVYMARQNPGDITSGTRDFRDRPAEQLFELLSKPIERYK